MDERPTLHHDLAHVWSAWKTLSPSRQWISTGFGAAPGPLGFELIEVYSKRFGPHGDDEFEEFFLLLMAMDSVYLEHEMKRIEKKSKKGSSDR